MDPSCLTTGALPDAGLPVRVSRLDVPHEAGLAHKIRSSSSESGIVIDLVHDADDGGVDRRGLLPERLAGRAPFEHDEHLLVHAGAHAVDGQKRPFRGRSSRFNGWTSRSFAPSNLRCFLVETSVPMTQGHLHG